MDDGTVDQQEISDTIESNTSDNTVTVDGANNTINSIIPEEPEKKEATIDLSKDYHELEKEIPEKTELAIDPKSTATKAQAEEVLLGKWHSIKELANALGFGRAYMSLLVKEGRIKAVKILGGQWRIPHSEYERLTKEGIVPMRKMKEDVPTTKIYAKGDDEEVAPAKAKEKEGEAKAEDKPIERFPHFRFKFF